MTSSNVLIILAQVLLLCACGASNGGVNLDESLANLDASNATDSGDNNCVLGNTFAPIPEKALIEEVCRITNRERAKLNLTPLELETQRTLVAQAHSEDMADRNFFNHENPEGLDPFDRLANAGITYTSAAENIAVGQITATQVVADWMKSSGHRANILNSKFARVGIGSRNGRWTQVFTN